MDLIGPHLNTIIATVSEIAASAKAPGQGWIDTHLWLIPLMPLLGAISHIFFGRLMGKKAVGILACVLVFTSFLLSLCALARLIGLDPDQRNLVNHVLPWIHVGKFKVDWAFRADTLSVVMLLVVTGVGFLIHVYSTGYMDHDPRYIRFFAYLNLFTFAMLVLVLASNVFLMFIGWEGVGLCSYLLIGFWFEDINNAKAGMKAFIVNRIGDFSFICGTLLLFWYFGTHLDIYTLDFYEINKNAHLLTGEHAWVPIAACLLFFGGATGKSAQIPLYVWLPDAMAGPTPVSALIHAATMVTSGVYMIARLSGLYLNAPEAMMVVATVGAVTALFAATIAFAQNDIKKVLAYSTVSQLGYMFLGVGVGAFQAGVFHLTTHAFFKGLLFLGAGSVIHGMHNEQDMRKMGALRSKMPYTWITFMCAWLAISGFPGLSGFFSKDEILWKTFTASFELGFLGKTLWVVGFAAAGMTAFYMTRLIVMTFYGKKRWDAEVHPHESSFKMTVPLMILAVLSIIGGYIGRPASLGGKNHIEHWMHNAVTWEVSATVKAKQLGAVIEPVHGETVPDTSHDAHTAVVDDSHAAETSAHDEHAAHGHDPMEYVLMLASIGIGLAGMVLGWWMYTRRQDIPEAVVTKWPAFHRLVENKYYIDEIYDFIIVQNVLRLARFSGKFDAVVVDGAVNGTGWLTRKVSGISGWIDNNFVDGTVNAIAEITQGIGKRVAKAQTGHVQQYLTISAAFMALFISGVILWPGIEPWWLYLIDIIKGTVAKG